MSSAGIIRIAALALLLVVPFAIGAEPQSENSPPLASFDIARDGAAIFVPVVIEGHTRHFLVDTGATLNVVDVKFREHLGPKIKTATIDTADAPIEVDIFRGVLDAKLGTLPVARDRPVVCLDLSPLREVVGRSCDGVLGLDFLVDYMVQLDFDEGRIEIFRSGAATDGTLGKKCPIKITRGGVYVTAIAGRDKTADFMIDTGDNSEGGLETALFDALVDSGKLTILKRSLRFAASGESQSVDGRLELFSLAGFQHEGLIVDRDRCSIGLKYLSRYNVTIDFPTRTMYLEKSREYARPSRMDMTGLVLKRIEGRTVVHRVVNNSPAQRLGIRTGDFLTRVNGKPIDDLDLSTIYRNFRGEEGTKVNVTVEQAGQSRELTVILEVLRNDG